MNKIKMSDVFPVGCCIAYAISMTDDQVRYMDTAVRAYDANQKSISNLRSAVHNLATDGLKQDKRITELEAALLELIDTASQCDSWESFPSDALDDATAAAIGDNNETT